MITASHNAPRYNGLKLKADLDAAARPDQAEYVEAFLARNQERARFPNVMDYDTAFDQNLIRRFDPGWAYCEHLGDLIDTDVISASELRVVEIRGEMNPGFGGIHPEPVGHYLAALDAGIQAHHADTRLTTYGDGDHLGTIDDLGNFVDPHDLFGLALRYLVEERGWRGTVVKSISTTRMVDRLAQQYDLPVNSPVAGAPELRLGALSAELDSEGGAFTPPSDGGGSAPLHPRGQPPPLGMGLPLVCARHAVFLGGESPLRA